MTKGENAGIYALASREDIARSIRSGGLASPDHYRLYFAFEQPRNSPCQSDFERFFETLDKSIDEASKLADILNSEIQTTGATKLEAILDRIVEQNNNGYTIKQAETLLLSLADKLDDLGTYHSGDYGRPPIWASGGRVFKWLLPRLATVRERFVAEFFKGKSIEWLTSLLRDELFAHGRVEGRKGGEPLLEPEDLDLACSVMLARYRRMDLATWRKLRSPLNALFAWRQAGDADGPGAMIASAAENDDDFISAIELLTQRISTAHGTYRALRESTLLYFLDYQNARTRIEYLTSNATNPALRYRAHDVLDRFKLGVEL